MIPCLLSEKGEKKTLTEKIYFIPLVNNLVLLFDVGLYNRSYIRVETGFVKMGNHQKFVKLIYWDLYSREMFSWKIQINNKNREQFKIHGRSDVFV